MSILFAAALPQNTLCDCTKIDAEVEELRQEINGVAELSRKAIQKNARIAHNQDSLIKTDRIHTAATNRYLIMQKG